MDIFKDIEDRLAPLGTRAFLVHQGKLWSNPKLLDHFRSAGPSEVERVLIAPEKHSYEGGEVALRSLIATRFFGTSDDRGIALCNGGTHGLALAFGAVLQTARPIVHVLSPHWMYLPGVIEHAGGRVRELPTLERGVLLDEETILGRLEADLGPTSGAIYLASPANPVGNVFSDRFLERVLALCETHGVACVLDHAYYGFTRDARPKLEPLRAIFQHPRLCNVFTFSKFFGAPGIRLGFVHASAEIAARITETYRFTNYTPNSFSQTVAYAFLGTDDLFATRVKMFQENLEITRRLLAPIAVSPEGGFFAFVRLTRPESYQALLAEGVGLVDGRLFGKTYGSYGRLCFTAERPERLETCCRILLRCLEESVS